MGEQIPSSKEEDTLNEQFLSRKDIAVKLRQLGVDVDFEDWDGLDDNDVLDIIVTLAMMHNLDLDEILQLTVPIVKRRREEEGEPSEI